MGTPRWRYEGAVPMPGFPIVDPIPLPAPVWLFKLLHIVTLSLHFVAMETLVGALLIAALLNLLGRSGSTNLAAGAIARRLTVVMTYVINLGVPPLLFAQVLYGRAIYTSSVLIGAYWISVIPALVLVYWLLYRFAAGIEEGRKVWWMALLAWIITGGIADVYTTNMTLMLRPEVWQKMYSASPLGTHLPTGDPTGLPRFLFMLIGGFVAAGLWLIYLSGRKSFVEVDRRYLSVLGGRIAGIASIGQLIAAYAVYHAQPIVVQAALNEHLLYKIAGLGWLLLEMLILIFAGFVAISRPMGAETSWVAVLLSFLSIALMTLYRDGIRDFTLLSKGYDVWQRTVVTNWSVVGLFLVLFVAGLGMVGWLISVVARADHGMERAI
jgi:hypothetical protein